MFVNRSGRAQLLLVVLLLVYTAWARGGTPEFLQKPLPLLGALMLSSVFLIPMVYRKQETAWSILRTTIGRLLRDPILYLGSAFLLLLALQWWNAGRSLVFDRVGWEWIYSAPRIPWLPSAVNPVEAREMLYWFFPALALVLSLRSGILQRSGSYPLFLFMSLNAAVLALFGILQFASGTQAIFWMSPLDCDFFASFGYTSHAAAFFLLMFSVTCGLALGGVFSKSLRASRAKLIVLILIALLCFVGVHLSLALAPVILVWVVAVAVAAHALLLSWQRLRPAKRVHVVLGIVAVACLAYLLVALLFHLSPDRMRAGFWEIGKSHVLEQKFNERAFLVKPAWAIWKDNLWFGVGGWGFRYFLSMSMDPSQWSHLKAGYANVHNDPVQFLAEFGLVGAGLMGAIVIVLVTSIYRSGAWRRPVAFVPLLGTFLVLAYSLMDLPFRCPAILYSWLAVLAATPGFMVSRLMPEKMEST